MPQSACLSCSSVHPFRAERRHQLMHSISQAQVWSSCRFLQPDLLSAMKSIRSSVETTTPAPTPGRPLPFGPHCCSLCSRAAVHSPGLQHWPHSGCPPSRHAPDLHKLCLRALYTWHLGVSIRVTFTTRPCLTTSYLPAKRHNSLFPIYLFHLFPTAYYPLEVILLIYLLIGLFSISTLPPLEYKLHESRDLTCLVLSSSLSRACPAQYEGPWATDVPWASEMAEVHVALSKLRCA